MQTNTNLLNAFKEISDTYNDISQGDYISKMMKPDQKLESQQRSSAQDRSVPKPPVQDISQKQESRDSAPEKSEPNPDESAQKPTVQHKSCSRGRG